MKLPPTTNPNSFSTIIIDPRGQTNTKNLTGLTFGRLTAIKPVDRNKDNRIIWLCKCSCGNYLTTIGKTLSNGGTQSCGCFKQEQQSKCGKASAKDLTNQRFGRLVALSPTDNRQGSQVIWSCLCDCGKEHSASVSDLIRGGVKSCGCLLKDITQQRFSEYRISKGLPADVLMTEAHEHIYGLLRPLMKLIYSRDNRQCAICSYKGHKLEIHHIVKRSDDISLAYEPTNVITLCKTCHRTKAHLGNCAGIVDEQIAKQLSVIALQNEIINPTNSAVIQEVALNIKQYLKEAIV
jgi:hypothetical protein